MAHQRQKPRYKALAVSIALSLVILFAGIAFTELDLGSSITGLLFPMGRLMFFISVGLAAGRIIEASGWTKYLAFFAAPLFRFGRLGSHCSAAFTTAFFSGAAANAMLLGFYKEEKISRRQLYLSNLVNQLPAYFLHLPTTFFIVLPLTGKAGIFYFLLTFTATLVRTAGFLIYGHFVLSPGQEGAGDAAKGDAAKDDKKVSRGAGRGVLKDLAHQLPARIINIALFVLPIYVFVFVLNRFGMFRVANEFISRYIVTSFMPVESLSVVVLSFAAEFTSGFAAAGALMEAGVLSIKQTVLALVIGNIIAFPIRALRHQLPRYMGIFSPKMGLQILLLGQGLRVISLILVAGIFYLVANDSCTIHLWGI